MNASYLSYLMPEVMMCWLSEVFDVGIDTNESINCQMIINLFPLICDLLEIALATEKSQISSWFK